MKKRWLAACAAALTLLAACGGGTTDGGGLEAAALAAVQRISPADDAADAAQFGRTLTVAPVGVQVQHWDPSVPPKVPPFSDTEIRSHGIFTTVLDAAAVAGVEIDYPAGSGPYGFTVLADQADPLSATTYHIVHFEVQSDLALQVADPTLLFEYAFVFDADGLGNNNYTEQQANWYTGSDRWYELTWTNAQGWRLKAYTATTITNMSGTQHVVTEVFSAARVVLTGNALVLLVPAFEFTDATPSYRVTAFVHDGDWGIPAPHSWSGNPEPRLVEGLQAYPAQS